jgi:hypothetical protein
MNRYKRCSLQRLSVVLVVLKAIELNDNEMKLDQSSVTPKIDSNRNTDTHFESKTMNTC